MLCYRCIGIGHILKQIDAQIAQVKAWKNDASVMIENGKIYSPISWVVIKKLAEVWQVVWAWTPIYVVATDNDIKVVVWVDDETKSKINVWEDFYIYKCILNGCF